MDTEKQSLKLLEEPAEPVIVNMSVYDTREEQYHGDATSFRPSEDESDTASRSEECSTVQYLSRKQLLSRKSPTLQLDVPAKLLSTEEDLADEEPEMVIVEEKRFGPQEVYLDDLKSPADMDIGSLESSSNEYQSKDIGTHLTFSEECIDEANEKGKAVEEHVQEYSSFSSRPRLPFTFTGQTFNEQTQKLILNVLDFFKRVKKNPGILDVLKGPQDHAAAALNIGPKTIGKIAKRVLELGKLETPGKKRPRSKSVLDSVDSQGEEVIRSIIKSMHERRIAPTVPLVMAEASTKINFKGSTTSLRRLLKRMGYRYSNPENQISTDRDRISGCGWKEKSTKRVRRKPQKLKTSTNEAHRTAEPAQQIQLLTSTNGTIPHSMNAERTLTPHGLANIIHPQDIIIHYQKPDDTFHNQILTVTGESAEVIQLQIDPNVVEHGGTVQEWHWQPCPQDSLDTSSILKS